MATGITPFFSVVSIISEKDKQRFRATMCQTKS